MEESCSVDPLALGGKAPEGNIFFREEFEGRTAPLTTLMAGTESLVMVLLAAEAAVFLLLSVGHRLCDNGGA